MSSNQARRRKLEKQEPENAKGAKQKKIEIPNDFKDIKGGQLFCLGEGSFGQLGLGEDMMTRKKPTPISSITDEVKRVECGGMHTICLTAKHEVYTFGCNDEGALGRDTSEEGSEFEPGIVEGELKGKSVVDVTAGDSHSAALTEDGEVYLWGCFRDSHGKLGLLEEFNGTNVPVKVPVNVTVKCISSGTDHIAMVTTGGDILTIGCGEQGQLGRISRYFIDRGGRRKAIEQEDENNNRQKKFKSKTEKSTNRDEKGNICLIPQKVRMPKRGISRNAIFDRVYAGSYCTYAVTSTDQVFVFGLNNYNQLGIPDEENKFIPTHVPILSTRSWKSICPGQHHTILLEDKTNHVYAIGRGDYGRLGLGEEVTQANKPIRITSIQNAVSIGCGGTVSFAVLKDGSGLGWGLGTNLQLTTGEEDDEWEPVELSGKQLLERNILQVKAGGQHTAIIACNKK